MIRLTSGDNTWSAAIESAAAGEYRGVLDADHLDLVGVKLEDKARSKFDHLSVLDRLTSELITRGY